MTPEVDAGETPTDAAHSAVGNSGAPMLRFAAWEGPLDLLLELARAQRVDLAQISVAALATQFAAAAEAAIAAERVPLARVAEWVVMAAWLLALRARLLLPASTAESAEAEREAADLRRRLADREAARRLADWLERRPQLGREVFGRGAAEPAATAEPAADVTELLRACLKLLQVTPRERVYRPQLPYSGGHRTPWTGSAPCCPACRKAPRWSSSCRRRPGRTRPCGGAVRWPAPCWPGSS